MSLADFLTNLIRTETAAVFGLLGAVFGGGLGFLGNWLLQRTQMAHERKENQDERRMQVRKEIYLEAVEAMSASASAITQLASGSPPQDMKSLLAGVGPSSARVDLVAEPRTREAFGRLNEENARALLRLMKRRMLVDRNAEAIEELEAETEQLRQQQQYVLKMIQDLRPSADPQERLALLQHFDEGDDLLRRRNELLAQQRVSLVSERIGLLITAIQAVHSMGPARAQLISCYREEFGLAPDSDEQLAKQAERADRLVKEFRDLIIDAMPVPGSSEGEVSN